ncbi:MULTISPECIES: hypothetical protein [Yersinia]|uniref:hypothetical protein n=1 Tax=Yersinia TaxID=629 RepID=UPI0005DB7A66|nr:MULTISPECIES: hypothetical protein [Yersinia]EKN4722047.1 hypothetical protein [Yersinia enterocolitica]EKN4734179.1 hypothetical protein [Yersinia enterocolitica]MBO1591326.1 hypothetical protein [Yersinia pseudotuberculosis]CQJ32014.1 Uncharacterised protein [Yersinia enterocolitica]HEN3433988.1 hypothetical protein [Yersinia enterocolitica]
MQRMSKAYLDVYGDDTVTPSQFRALERQRNSECKPAPFAICIGCQSKLSTYGVDSPNVTECFRHPDNAPTTCFLRSSSRRYGLLKDSIWDDLHGRKLRTEFMQSVHLLRAYEICHKVKGGDKGCLSIQDFISLLEVSDVKGLWNYKRLEIWSFSLLLLLNMNYQFKKSGKKYYFHLTREVTRRNCPDNEWWNGLILQPCWLENNEKIDEKYQSVIPFTQDEYTRRIQNPWGKENTFKSLFSHFVLPVIR